MYSRFQHALSIVIGLSTRWLAEAEAYVGSAKPKRIGQHGAGLLFLRHERDKVDSLIKDGKVMVW
jgi:hypothetical protein